ncbi:trigger factor [Nakamurella flavida]|uniref:Trigger factor n=1 Tax=Nakamurella flavida TaxID=363630 RepID=A0A939C435_9ACTN|nr:trigger factor [Nakamurella flavida]MBM9474827.1 trigger factor [Nakamurella flavida]MDP9776397.1 trigger factor [Nakamurella flavida]
MKSTVEHLNPTRVKLTVEVPFDELKPQFDKAYKTLAGQVRIPGFRPGKVPARILDARLGRGAILSEVVNDAVPAKYGQAVSEASLTVLGQPEIEVTRIDDNDTLAFTAEVDVRPEITLPELDGLAVTVDDVEITEADVDEQVDALRERFATTTVVERPAADGDAVVIDLRAAVDGDELPEASADALTYRIGEGDLVEGIDEAVTGMSAGDVSTFTTKLVAGEYAGQDADVTVAVTAVQERELPAVDDDFAQLASEFDSVAELRADLTEKIRRVKNLTQGTQARDKVLEALLAATEVPTPESIVKAEFDARVHDAIHSFDHDEAAFAVYLEGEGRTREEFDAELRTAAEEAVKTQLLLDALAESRGVGVDQDEFTQRVIYNAQRFGLSPDDYFKRLQEANQLGSVFADVRRGKALAGVVEQATVTDASGNVLDIAALFGVEDVEDDEDETAGVIEGSVQDPTDTADHAVDEDGSTAAEDDLVVDDDGVVAEADPSVVADGATDGEVYADSADSDTLAAGSDEAPTTRA